MWADDPHLKKQMGQGAQKNILIAKSLKSEVNSL